MHVPWFQACARIMVPGTCTYHGCRHVHVSWLQACARIMVAGQCRHVQLMQRRAKTSLKVGSVKPCFLLPWKHCSMHIQWVNTFFSPDSLQGNQVEPVQKLVSQETSAAFQCKITPLPLFTFYSLPSSLFSPLSPLSLSSLSFSLLLSFSPLSSLLYSLYAIFSISFSSHPDFQSNQKLSYSAMFWSQGSRHYSAARHSVKTDLFCAGSVCTVSSTVFLKHDLGTKTILKFALKDCFYNPLANIMPTVRRFIAHKACFC